MESGETSKNLMTKIILGICILLLLVIFSLQNSTTTLVKVFFWDFNAPLVLLFVVCFVLGLLGAIILLWPISRHSKRKSKLIEDQKARIEFLESLTHNKDNNKFTE